MKLPAALKTKARTRAAGGQQRPLVAESAAWLLPNRQLFRRCAVMRSQTGAYWNKGGFLPFLLLGAGGPASGVVFRLEDGPATIGRDPANSLPLNDPVLSRRHCRIEIRNGQPELEDLGSFNGTLVNGARVERACLRHEDEIRAGASLFRVVDLRLDSGSSPSCASGEAEKILQTMELPGGAAAPFPLELLAQRLYRHERDRAELRALLELASSLPSLTSFVSARRLFLETVFRSLPVRRAVLCVTDPASGASVSCGWDAGGAASPEELPEHAVALCLEKRAATLVELGADGRKLLMCPLSCDAGAAGVLALETQEGADLKARHLEWLCAAARLGGGVLLSLHRLEQLRRANRELAASLEAGSLLIGESPAMLAVKAQILKAAPTEATVLITGETGAGKEPVARAIHAASRRAEGPFVAVNCATLSPALLESDLFGHERGAFTGAVARKTGKIESAAGGTLFLDEIGELDGAVQARLLRVLQEREFERVGSVKPQRANVRIVAATNRDLAAEAGAGRFRQDLFYRLNVVHIHVPPLRERREDILLLAARFLSLCAERAPRRIAGISAAARRRLLAYDWPGNVRELQNAIERAVVLGSTGEIEEEDLPDCVLEQFLPAPGAEAAFHQGVREAKRRLILDALAQAGGKQQEAARLLGLHPTRLSRLIGSLGLRPAGGPAKPAG